MANETSGLGDYDRRERDRLEGLPRRFAPYSCLDLAQSDMNTTDDGHRLRRLPKFDQTNFLELRRDDVLVERLHDVFVGAAMHGARDMVDVVLSGAEHHLGLIAAGHATQIAEEFIAVHHRHVPVEQDRLGQATLADLERLLAILGFDDLEIQTFQDPPCDLSNHARVIDYQTCSHFFASASFDPRRDFSIAAYAVSTADVMPPLRWARFRGRDRHRGRP